MVADRVGFRRGRWLAASSVGVGVIAALVHPAVLRLAPPALCPAGLEWTIITLARLRPDVAIAPLAQMIDRVAFGAAIALFFFWLGSRTNRLIPSLAGAAALAALPALDTTLAPLPNVPLLLSMAAAIACTPVRGLFSTRRLVAVTLALAALAASTSALALPLAVVSGLAVATLASWSATRRYVSALGAAAVVLAVGLLAPVMVLPLARGAAAVPACVAAAPTAMAPASAWSTFSGTVTMAGPYLCGLVALGLFVGRHAWRDPRVRLLAGTAAATLAGVVLANGSAGRGVSAPLLVAFWAAATVGLGAMVDACGATPVRRMVAAVFVLLTPVLVLSSRGSDLTRSSASGHERLSLSRMVAIRQRAPRGSAFVEEDAIADMLWRATAASHPDLGIVQTLVADRPAVADRARDDTRPVLALPHAQEGLQWHGFELAGLDGVPGVARVRDGGDCQLVGTAWRELHTLPRSHAFALAARDEAEAGPIVIYATFDTVPRLAALLWPPPTERGFYVTTYASASAAQAQLVQDMSDDGLPAEDRPAAGHPVARLELWRIPGAPLSLGVDLGAVPIRVVGHLIPPENPRRLMVCPAYPRDIGPLR